ncbi:hypothetical protein M5D96_011226 [Drosophila gunungcola]|uniref:Uncharacterized protein n=1 Tax=Drosophila gunungcola TaxID=103775 RepID=A0A9P9YFC8_9MUSC|nr:hypothetical protein M5D96_011226 [Drosophila gunungcola]
MDKINLHTAAFNYDLHTIFIVRHKLCEPQTCYQANQANQANHTLVRQDSQGEREPHPTNTPESSSTRTKPSTTGISNFSIETAFIARSQIIMSTILAHVVDNCGSQTFCRFLLDSGSTIIFAPLTHARISVIGLSTQAARVTGGVSKNTIAIPSLDGCPGNKSADYEFCNHVSTTQRVTHKQLGSSTRVMLPDPTFATFEFFIVQRKLISSDPLCE